ncbi:lethal(3)malignant brain tumor-like protein 4, partial [Perca fluviatilis]|uniref:lethal(3)malignant brain tumor-like protein 4 n=1 Tax=Perca fluviatilis TaxID=8168 RepID=UPI001965FAD6
KAEAAPLSLFTQAQSFPSRRNGFKVGMKLEGVDPLHPSLFCVLTVAEVIGCRLRLHIDGYSECYDFWVNADSAHIRPTGWCRDTNHRLHPPKGHSETDFDWQLYLESTGSHAAPPNLFTDRTASCEFSVGMKLEAVDRKNPGLVCVASVADVIDDHFLVHFDNWDDSYDYWCDSSSPYIHPVGWCEQQGCPLTAPQGHPKPRELCVEEYPRRDITPRALTLVYEGTNRWGEEETGGGDATRGARSLCSDVTSCDDVTRCDDVIRCDDVTRCVSLQVYDDVTVCSDDVTRCVSLQVHYDGWSQQFDVWSDSDLPDLHPVGWSQRTGHPLEPPPGSAPLSSGSPPSQGVCPTPGCRGVGHIKGARYTGHHSAFGCPYSDINMRKEVLLPDRLGGERAVNMGHHGNQSDRTRVQVKMEPKDESLMLPLGKRKRLADRLSQPTKYLCVKQEEEELQVSALGPAESHLQAALHQSVFLSAMSAQPGRDLSLCWEQHRKLLPGAAGVTAETVRHWSIQQVCDFVQSLPGCEDQAQQFRDEHIDGRAFLLLTQRDIVRIMAIKLGPALKIYNCILMFKHAEETDQSHAEDQSRAEERSQSHAKDQSHTEDQSHAEDQSRAEEKSQSHAKERNQSHKEDQSHTEDQSHAENQSHAEDQSHAEIQSHADIQSHAEDQSRAEDQSHAEERNQSHDSVQWEGLHFPSNHQSDLNF